MEKCDHHQIWVTQYGLVEQEKHLCSRCGLLAGLECFRSLVHVEAKNGPRVLFWHDVWCGDQPLKIQFLQLFRKAILKDATVHDVVSWKSDQSHWNITFSRSPND